MNIKIQVESGGIPGSDFFTTVGKLVRNHGWYLNTGDSYEEDGVMISRSYSDLTITQLSEAENEISD